MKLLRAFLAEFAFGIFVFSALIIATLSLVIFYGVLWFIADHVFRFAAGML